MALCPQGRDDFIADKLYPTSSISTYKAVYLIVWKKKLFVEEPTGVERRKHHYHHHHHHHHDPDHHFPFIIASIFEYRACLLGWTKE